MSALALWLALEGVQLVEHGRVQESELVLSVQGTQQLVMYSSSAVTAGGVGGGAGAQLAYDRVYLAELDTVMLFGLGNTLATKLLLGAQLPGTWSPAAHVLLGALWGDRIEFLTGDARRPAFPTWALGLRLSPLRFQTAVGTVTVLQPGVGTDFDGGVWLELSMLALAAHL